jgi:hypothetical protein
MDAKCGKIDNFLIFELADFLKIFVWRFYLKDKILNSNSNEIERTEHYRMLMNLNIFIYIKQ